MAPAARRAGVLSVTLENGIAVAVAVIALKAVAELGQVIKSLIDRRRETPAETASNAHIGNEIGRLADNIHDLRSQLQTFVLSTSERLRLVEWRLDHPEERHEA